MTEEPTPPFLAPAGRFIEILVGLIALSASGFLVWFGAKGAWMYLLGSRAEPASPLGWVIGLGAGGWGGYAGARMLFGLRQDRDLVPNGLLYVGGVAMIIGGIAAAFVELPRGFIVGVVLVTGGVAAIRLAARRKRGAPPEATH